MKSLVLSTEPNGDLLVRIRVKGKHIRKLPHVDAGIFYGNNPVKAVDIVRELLKVFEAPSVSKECSEG